MVHSLEDSLAWVAAGTDLFSEAIASYDDASFSEPSALPGWTRAHVIAHVIGNARGLANLVTWANTGVETPMYTSLEQRNADIEAWATRSPAELRAEFTGSSEALASGFDALNGVGWSAEVRTIQGRTIRAAEIPWLRSREVMIHAVDLSAGTGFEALPDSFLAALTEDIVQRRSTTASHPALVLEAPGRRWEITGSGEAMVVSGSLPQIAGYLAGRVELGPQIPAWL